MRNFLPYFYIRLEYIINQNETVKIINLKIYIMKKMAIFVALVLSAFICNAQEVIELRETRVGYDPVAHNITNHGNAISVFIQERYTGEFSKDPVRFMHNHFDIQQVISQLGVSDYETYHVSFKSNKGVLVADFDEAGKLTGTFLRLKNIAVPNELKHQLYRDFKGWEMVKNRHIASESNGKTRQNFYKITMKKGNQKVNLKINAADIGKSTLVALN